jgi:uncharacterized phage-associated protein
LRKGRNIKMIFNEEKATQVTAYILEKLGGSEYYLKIIKLLYLADRKAINVLGFPITSDRYVSMNNGPVLSAVYDLIIEGPDRDIPSYWHNYISPAAGYKISLTGNPGTGKLNQLEKEVIDSIVEEFGKWSRWDIVDFCHRFPEYQYPEGSSIPITIEQICSALKKNPEDVQKINNKIEFANNLEMLISSDC